MHYVLSSGTDTKPSEPCHYLIAVPIQELDQFHHSGSLFPRRSLRTVTRRNDNDNEVVQFRPLHWIKRDMGCRECAHPAVLTRQALTDDV